MNLKNLLLKILISYVCYMMGGLLRVKVTTNPFAMGTCYIMGLGHVLWVRVNFITHPYG